MLLLLALGLGAWSARIAQLALTVRDEARRLESLAENPSREALAAAGPLLSQARRDLAALRRTAAPLLWVGPLLGWVPVYGEDIAASRAMLDAAVELSTAADESFSVLSPLFETGAAGTAILPSLLDRLEEDRVRLAAAGQAMERGMRAWGQIPIESLSPKLRPRLERLDPMLPAIEAGLGLALSLPELLGGNGARTYLLLAQNEDELRATGGFISGAGIVSLDGGRLSGFGMIDSYAVDDLSAAPHPPPPEPLRRYMLSELWLFRDSNWSPDFPASARMAAALYEAGQGQEIDGVIAFDQAALRILLAAIGPVAVEGAPEPIGAENVADYMRAAWAPAPGQGMTEAWWLERKAFMGHLAKAVLLRLETGGAGLDLPALGRATRQMLDERHLQVYLEEPRGAGALAGRGWDGAVRPGEADFLMLVDSNLGFNKVNPNVDAALAYSVDLSRPGSPRATLTVRHANRSPGSSECLPGPDYGTGRYEDMLERCYWDYLRVLVPGGSELLDGSVAPVPAAWTLSGVAAAGEVDIAGGEAGSTSFGAFLVVPGGEVRVTRLEYALPATVLGQAAGVWQYRLAVQKQAGAPPLPVTIEVRLPASAALVAASPPPQGESQGRLRFELLLTRDQRVSVDFQTP